ncbi:7593_t:CDS:2 [Diversispora eburnea]|uniref:7593_t:CDS:1 n=1 Tax=Diversispora eburnea TaxID=1213867 RepID=A0A9N9A840_9GLOM|nr:7593_t:CDS:2 [Diversispora eburnea]
MSTKAPNCNCDETCNCGSMSAETCTCPKDHTKDTKGKTPTTKDETKTCVLALALKENAVVL